MRIRSERARERGAPPGGRRHMAGRWFELHSLLLIKAHRQTGQTERHGARFRTICARRWPNGTLQLDDVVLATGQFLHPMLRGIRTRLLCATQRRPGVSERGNIARQAVRIFVAGCRAGK
ncbi:TetR/AcrR family transcriptional regulator C-terminal domain-containing protein [Paraburkholderia sp. GAS32]|uniref:TetR/AcrR family transcriptional regulator C-terminal domain-containing protein n=1 Tax=Paraburkholderia sp. GAS32 TaxID=3035129 RepID=UPI003D217DFC